MLLSKFWFLKGYPVVDYIIVFLTDTEVKADLTDTEVEAELTPTEVAVRV